MLLVEVGTLQQSMGQVMPIDPNTAGFTLAGNLDPAADKPTQTMTWAQELGMAHSQQRIGPKVEMSVAATPEASPVPEPESDPRAQCGG